MSSIMRHPVLHVSVHSLIPLKTLKISLLQVKLPLLLFSLFSAPLSSLWPPKFMLLHVISNVLLIIDFLELPAPDLLPTAKGIEIEYTVREKQINYNK